MLNKLDNKTYLQSNLHSALKIFQASSSAEGNLLISPYSLLNNFALIYTGSRGETKEQIAQVLQFPQDPAQLNSTSRDYIELISSICSKSENEVLFAHSLWPQVYTPFFSSFTRLARENYLADLTIQDYTRPEKVRQAINDWADNKTDHKIQELLPSGKLNDFIRMIVVQLGYFRGSWIKQFNPANTRSGLFFTKKIEWYDIPMMSQTGLFNYYGDEEIQWIEIPFQGQDFSITIILPRQMDNLTQIVSSITQEKLLDWQTNAQPTQVELSMPRFEMNTSLQLCPALRSLGINLAFGPQADFSGMNGFNWHYISICLHRASIKVDENYHQPTTGAPDIPPKMNSEATFHVDHPFLFLVRETLHGGILFIGRFCKP